MSSRIDVEGDVFLRREKWSDGLAVSCAEQAGEKQTRCFGRGLVEDREVWIVSERASEPVSFWVDLSTKA